MKIIVNPSRLDNQPEAWIRRAGYGMLPPNRDGIVSFARRLSRDFYPRYHIYIDRKNEKGEDMVIFNIHLDQKKPGYVGVNRHNAEYDGEVVEREVARLRSFLLPNFME